MTSEQELKEYANDLRGEHAMETPLQQQIMAAVKNGNIR